MEGGFSKAVVSTVMEERIGSKGCASGFKEEFVVPVGRDGERWSSLPKVEKR